MRYRAIIRYDGSQFDGFQVQKKGRTIQEELERVMENIHHEPISIYASGRTDAKVHALAQVIHFDSPLEIKERNWLHAINTQLPNDIRVTAVHPVNEKFHARFDVIQKEYRYFLRIGSFSDPFERSFVATRYGEFDIDRMREASNYLIGTHDFTSFSATGTKAEDRERTIHEISINKEGNLFVFSIKGDGFLRHMVRILVGTLLDVGSGRIEVKRVPQILEAKDRKKAKTTAPPEGLYLWNVKYKNFESNTQKDHKKGHFMHYFP